VEAITPRHSRQQYQQQHQQQHRGHGHGHPKRESRRSRANNRLRVKGRFVKRGTPGLCLLHHCNVSGHRQRLCNSMQQQPIRSVCTAVVHGKF
jgi:hypothetical protein